MKVSYNTKEFREKFIDIDTGEVFEIDGGLYMKVINRKSDDFNAIDIRNGFMVYFEDDDLVLLVKGEYIVQDRCVISNQPDPDDVYDSYPSKFKAEILSVCKKYNLSIDIDKYGKFSIVDYDDSHADQLNKASIDTVYYTYKL